MAFVEVLPKNLELGDVFYAQNIGYAVVVRKQGVEGMAYTTYMRPLKLEQESYGYKVVFMDTECNTADTEGNSIPVEFELTNQLLGIKVAPNWKQLYGKDAESKLALQLVGDLRSELNPENKLNEEQRWEEVVNVFRRNQKIVRVAGKLFRPATVNFVCGFEVDGVRKLYFTKKITRTIYEVRQDITKENAKYEIKECAEDTLKLELIQAVRVGLISMASYATLFGLNQETLVQVNGIVPIEVQERIRWSQYSIPQVLQAGMQALEDAEFAKRVAETNK